MELELFNRDICLTSGQKCLIGGVEICRPVCEYMCEYVCQCVLVCECVCDSMCMWMCECVNECASLVVQGPRRDFWQGHRFEKSPEHVEGTGLFYGHCSDRCCGLCLGVRRSTGLDPKTQILGKPYVLLEARGPGSSQLMCWPKVNSWAGRLGGLAGKYGKNTLLLFPSCRGFTRVPEPKPRSRSPNLQETANFAWISAIRWQRECHT